MEYRNITIKKYQIIKHIINKYAESHNDVKPNMNYDREAEVLDITGISKPISFNTESIGIIPKGAYEVVGQVIRSKTDDGHIDENGMNLYNSAQRIFNIANDNRQKVFNFIDENSKSSYCSCCGTNRERNKLFYIRRVDNSDTMYQVGSRCINEHFDTSYFDLMKEISNVIEQGDKTLTYQFSDYNLIDYLALYCIFAKTISNIKSCSKKVIEVLDSFDSTVETKLFNEFTSQKATNSDKITAIAKFYTEYPNYIREDNMFAIKTVQSMAEMLNNNVDVDPYYSKTNCLNIAKMYMSLLSDYARDYRRYEADLFKYNAYLVETALLDIWEKHNNTEYKLGFELSGRVFNIKIINAKSDALASVRISVPLDNSGNMANENKSKSEIIALASKINEYYIIKSQKSNIVDCLNKYKDECISRYSSFNPTILVKCEKGIISFSDYANEPLSIKVADDIEQSKMKVSTYINMLYVRQKISNAYKEFSKKYLGKITMAYTQPKQINLQFSCDYAEKQFKANWPKDITLFRIISRIDSLGDNIVINYNKSSNSLKLPVNTIGIISGADYDINLRIQTFIAKELNLEMPKVKKIRERKTDEEIVKLRPKKNVTRLFSEAGTSARNLVMIRSVNVLDDTSSNTLGVSAGKIGKILFNIENGNAVYKDDKYQGRITLDGHTVSDEKKFDKKTLANAVHALEYLVYLSDEVNNLAYIKEVTATKTGVNYTYKYNLTLGNCTGVLQFRISQINNKCILKCGPKFIIDKDNVACMINLNFNEDCWKDIQQGTLNLNDIQRGPAVVGGQKNKNLISGSTWINNESQKLTNELFTKLTGINV